MMMSSLGLDSPMFEFVEQVAGRSSTKEPTSIEEKKKQNEKKRERELK